MADPKSLKDSDSHPLIGAITSVLIAILVFTPLVRAGLTPLSALVSQLLAVVLATLLLWSPSRLRMRPVEWLVLALLILTPLLYLIPLPAVLVDRLPGRALYAEAMAWLDPSGNAFTWKPLSLVPAATTAAALALVVPVAVFVAARTLDAGRAEIVVRVLLGIAALQALFGLLQFGVAQGGLQEAWGIQAGFRGSGAGTYPNRNHLAGLIELTLPVALALFFYHFGRSGPGYGREYRGRKAAFWGSKSGHATVIYGALVLLLIVAVVVSRSRTGIFLVIVGMVVSTLVFSRRIGGGNVYGPTGTIISLASVAAIATGLTPLLNRFSIESIEQNMRWKLFELTLRGAGDFFPFGSGPGTFQYAFSSLQPVELGGFFINRAHNDYLEWFFDAGLPALAIVVAILVLFVTQWMRIVQHRGCSRGHFVQIGAGIGMLLLALHELVDYNLCTPANQVAFAVLAGIFFVFPQEMLSNEPESRRRHMRKPGTGADRRRSRQSGGQLQPPTQQIPNPFLDP